MQSADLGACLAGEHRPRALTFAYGCYRSRAGLAVAMVVATMVDRGVHLPHFELAALQPRVLFGVTVAASPSLGDVDRHRGFETLEPAFGVEAERSRRAFGSLLLVVVTSAVVLLLLGPAIVAVTWPGCAGLGFYPGYGRTAPRPVALVGYGNRCGGAAGSGSG